MQHTARPTEGETLEQTTSTVYLDVAETDKHRLKFLALSDGQSAMEVFNHEPSRKTALRISQVTIKADTTVDDLYQEAERIFREEGTDKPESTVQWRFPDRDNMDDRHNSTRGIWHKMDLEIMGKGFLDDGSSQVDPDLDARGLGLISVRTTDPATGEETIHMGIYSKH